MKGKIILLLAVGVSIAYSLILYGAFLERATSPKQATVIDYEDREATPEASRNTYQHIVTHNTDEVHLLVNAEREANGLTQLTRTDQLNTSATKKCEDMVEHDYYGHYSPETGKPGVHYIYENYNDYHLGENLALGFFTAAGVVDGWMNSQGHRENILRPSFHKVGYASCKIQERNFVVQHFAEM